MEYYAYKSAGDSTADMPEEIPTIEANDPNEARQILVDRFRMVGFNAEIVQSNSIEVAVTCPFGREVVYLVISND